MSRPKKNKVEEVVTEVAAEPEVVDITSEVVEVKEEEVQAPVVEPLVVDFSEVDRVFKDASLSTRNDFPLKERLKHLFTKFTERGLNGYTPYETLKEALIRIPKKEFAAQFEVEEELVRKLKEDLIK